jgi:tetratricopeptide (TPR) repeat protein
MKNIAWVLFSLACFSCASFNWDGGFSDDDRVQMLITKSSDTADDADENIAKYIEAREYLLRARNIDPADARVRTAVTSLESDIVFRKKQEYQSGKLLAAQKKYIDAAIRLMKARVLKFPDKTDTTDEAVAKTLDAIRPALQKEIEGQVALAQKKEKEKQPQAALDIYKRILAADPANGLARGKIDEYANRQQEEARRQYDLGIKNYHAKNYDLALQYLKKSYAIHKAPETLALINKINIAQVNRKYIAQAEAALESGNAYSALLLYKKCAANDPQNEYYDKKIAACRDKLAADLAKWYAEGVDKYNANDFEAAVDRFEKIVTVDYHYKDAKDYYEKSRQKLEAALKTL